MIVWTVGLRSLRDNDAFDGIPISVDTFWSEVARAAVAAGADIINDVSGGTLDPDMHAVVCCFAIL